MQLIKHVFICIHRNWKKSAILFCLMFIIIHLFLGSVLILRTIDATMDHLFTQMPNQFAFSLNPAITRESEGATLETMDEIRNLSYVRSMRYSLSTVLQNSTGLIPHDPDSFFLPSRCPERNVCNFLMQGVSEPFFFELEEGSLIMTDGRTFLSEELEASLNVVLVSSEFAALNNLAIGDTLPMETEILHPDLWHAVTIDNHLDYLVHTEPFELKIIGFFEFTRPVSESVQDIISSELNSTFFVPNGFVASFFERVSELNDYYFTEEELNLLSASTLFRYAGHIADGFISLYDLRDAEAFEEQTLLLLPDSYTLRTPEFMGLDSVRSSMGSIHNIMNRFLYGAVAASILIIGFTVMLFWKDRHHEIGIYLALGKNKLGVLVQLLLENAWIVLPICILSFFSGNWLANHLNSWLLRNHLVINAAGESHTLWLYSNTITYEMVQELQQVTLDIPTFFIIMGVAVLALVLGAIIPALYLMRLNPKEILMSGKLG